MPTTGSNEAPIKKERPFIPSINTQDISLYLHVPFCEKKCGYCHFFVLPNKPVYHEQLMKGLEAEFFKWLPVIKEKKLISLYFGGGTPSLLGPKSIEHLIEMILKRLDKVDAEVEITLEANPEKLRFQDLVDFKNSGVNRLSIGVQTLDNPLLKTLGREHSKEVAIKSVENASKAGFNNISIDLMYDLPGQTEQCWANTLREARQLPIDHLSLYNLTIEPHTAFFKYKDKLEPKLPSQEASCRMLEKACEEFSQNGFYRYEISAFAKKEKYSRHNTGYWLGRDFLGLGPSAFSYFDKKRFRNIANLNRYTESLQKGLSPIDFEEKLPPKEALRELLVIQLRLTQGVLIDEFEALFGLFDEAIQKDIAKCLEKGFLEKKSGRLMLTELGKLFYDSLAEELIG